MRKNILAFIVAFVLYSLGIARIVHWFIYSNAHEAERKKDYSAFITGYRHSVSAYIPQLGNCTQLPELISIVFFGISGLIFLKQKTRFFSILAASAFIFAFWNLFSLM